MKEMKRNVLTYGISQTTSFHVKNVKQQIKLKKDYFSHQLKMTSNNLSSGIKEILESYKDEDGYISNTLPKNRENRLNILSEELKNISNENLLQYKLAHDLSEKWIDDYKVTRCDVGTVSYIMGIQLTHYTYEEIYNFIEKRDKDFHKQCVIKLYDVMKKNFIVTIEESNISKILAKIYEVDNNIKNLANTVDFTLISSIIMIAYGNMLNENIDIPYTLNWTKNIKKLLPYLYKEFEICSKSVPFGYSLPVFSNVALVNLWKENMLGEETKIKNRLDNLQSIIGSAEATRNTLKNTGEECSIM
jgi:hypothetical protein